jgi:macrolide-specific efflux system membrane fusion protein
MNKRILSISIAAVVIVAGLGFYLSRPAPPKWEEVLAEKATFLVTVPASGTVEPENKISVTSPINGRIDRIMVEEGAKVRRGQVIAWMSSTDRAALLDSAQVQGGQIVSEWAEVYKPTPILSPAAGVIIAKNIVAGQTVSQTTVLFELSDRLVIIADVDETDLGKIKLGQAAQVTVDSFPGLVVNTKVSRIAHQSAVKNSINTYEVLLLPEVLPTEFRAGLTASVQFLFQEKENAILVPTWVAEGRENFSAEHLVKKPGTESQKRTLQFGLSNGQRVEVTEGLVEGEILQVKKQNILGEKPATVFGVGSGGGRRR